MNFKKIIPIMGLLIMLILAIGSASASDVDSESIGEAANDLTVEEAIVDDSNIIEDENTIDAVADVDTSNDTYAIEDIETEAGVGNTLGSSSDNEILASTVKFSENKYSTYFNGSGNIISGKLKAGDTLDFTGTFTNKMFIINIPLTITCTDGSVLLKDCGFSFMPSDFNQYEYYYEDLECPTCGGSLHTWYQKGTGQPFKWECEECETVWVEDDNGDLVEE